MLELKNILIARDLDHSSDRALEYAFDLAETTGATLHVVYGALQEGHPDNVPPEAEIPDSVYLAQIREGQPRIANRNKGPGAFEVQYAVARDLDAVRALVGYADEHAVDLIVTGSHERSMLGRLFRGSVSEKIVRTAACPVSVVKPVPEA